MEILLHAKCFVLLESTFWCCIVTCWMRWIRSSSVRDFEIIYFGNMSVDMACCWCTLNGIDFTLIHRVLSRNTKLALLDRDLKVHKTIYRRATMRYNYYESAVILCVAVNVSYAFKCHIHRICLLMKLFNLLCLHWNRFENCNFPYC